MVLGDPEKKTKIVPLFGCQDIDLTLGGRRILEGINLEVTRGQVLGIVGPNGAGKTSLLEVLSGRVRHQRGQITLQGRAIGHLSIQQRVRMGIGRTYQTPVVPSELSVAQVLKAARKAFYPKLTSHQAEWAAEVVGLKVPGHARAGSLETLQRRKLLMACLIMRRPKVLLLDEPASGLLVAELDELDQVLRLLAREMKIALLVVEHRLELIAAVADQVLVLDVGQRITTGTPEDVFRNPEVQAAYFESGTP